MNVLFDLQSPSFLRLFDSTIQELVARGHRLTLMFWEASAVYSFSAGIEAVADSVVVVHARPRREDLWAPLAKHLRETVDYIRYLDPRLEADHLRNRLDKLPRPLHALRRVRGLDPRIVRTLLRLGLALERAIPSAPAVERLLKASQPDVAVVTPLVARGDQTDVVKSARALGVPSVLAVASWDHLTTKGVIREGPDRVLVWNDAQAHEAATLHLYPWEQIRVTGAHSFDRWFAREPSTTREAFCARVGLDPHRPFVLYTGSAHTMTSGEAERAFVTDWIRALRSSDDKRLAELGILIRPHPNINADYWRDAGPPDLGDVSLWPRDGAYAMTDPEVRSDLFDSLHHSVAVVGINTSAMIEAAIVGRPVFTIQTDEFVGAQGATLHFRYLLPENGGFVLAAQDFPKHLDQLAGTLAAPERSAAMRERFVWSFVRPQGKSVLGSQLVVDAIEEAAAAPIPIQKGPVAGRGVRVLLMPLAFTIAASQRLHIKRRARRVRRRAWRWLRNRSSRGLRRASRSTRHGRHRLGAWLGRDASRASSSGGR